MKKFETYLNVIQEEREMINEGKISNALVTGLIALFALTASLDAKKNQDSEREKVLYQKLQDHIQNVINNQKIKKEVLEQEIEKILSSKQSGDFTESNYKNFIDEIVKNKSITVGQKKYKLDLTDDDRQLVDEIFGGRKTYEMNVKEAAKFILNKIKFL